MSNPFLKKILIVDDEQEALTHLSNILKRADYQVISTTKGKEAVDLAMKLLPDLIILDMIMPDMGGSQVASTLKENSSTSNIPIIFLSGIITSNQPEAAEEETSRQHIMAKPIESKELLERINKIFLGEN